MSETVVHVTTLEQWKSVLDVWFEQGYEWNGKEKGYIDKYFNECNCRYLILIVNKILFSEYGKDTIEYADFMAQQEKNNG